MAQGPSNGNNTATRMGFSLPRFNNRAFNFGNNLSQAANALVPIMQLIPGLQNITETSGFQSMLMRGEGARLTDIYEGHRPNLTQVNTSAPQFSLRGPGGQQLDVGLRGIGQQAISERQTAFDTLTQLGDEQRAATAQFSAMLDGVLKKGGQIDMALAQMGPQATAAYNAAINNVRNVGRQTMDLVRMGVQASANLLNRLSQDQSRIREDFDNEITGRMEALATGIDGQARAGFTEHIRAMESAGANLSSEERAAIGMIYQRDAARTKVNAIGQLYEVAAENRVRMETSLNSTLGTAISTTISSVGGLVGTGINASLAAEQTAAELVKAKNTHLLEIQSTRKALMEVTGALSLDGKSRIFEMVTNTARPIAIFSDIMSTLFDAAFDVVAYNNNVEIQELMNEAIIQNPLHAGIFEGADVLQRQHSFDQQADLQKDLANRAILGGLAGGGFSFAGSMGGAAIQAQGARDAATTMAGSGG